MYYYNSAYEEVPVCYAFAASTLVGARLTMYLLHTTRRCQEASMMRRVRVPLTVSGSGSGQDSMC